MTYWFNNKKGRNGYYHSKSVSLNFHKQHFWKFYLGDNGAVKGNPKDSCYDLNIHFFGIFFSYTNWDFNSNYR